MARKADEAIEAKGSYVDVSRLRRYSKRAEVDSVAFQSDSLASVRQLPTVSTGWEGVLREEVWDKGMNRVYVEKEKLPELLAGFRLLHYTKNP